MTSLARRLTNASRSWLLEAFATANLAFLGGDIYLAHLANDFAHWSEWIPLVFSAIASALLLPGLVTSSWSSGVFRRIGLVVGGGAVVVGVVGLLLHLQSGFFAEHTLANLVYAAPFAAPLAYTGVGLLLLLNRMEDVSAAVWGHWVVFLALGGFVGNLALSLGDHAQNGFFHATEWLSVASAGFAVATLIMVIATVPSRAYLRFAFAVMVGQILIAGVGFALHLSSNLGGPSASIANNFIFGAPVFAPLLFADLAVLACLGIWHVLATNAVRDGQ